MSTSQPPLQSERSAASLRTWATFVLAINIVGAGLIGLTLGIQRDSRYEYMDKMVPNFEGIVLALAVLLSGFLTYAVLNALSAIAGDVAAIRKKMNESTQQH